VRYRNDNCTGVLGSWSFRSQVKARYQADSGASGLPSEIQGGTGTPEAITQPCSLDCPTITRSDMVTSGCRILASKCISKSEYREHGVQLSQHFAFMIVVDALMSLVSNENTTTRGSHGVDGE